MHIIGYEYKIIINRKQFLRSNIAILNTKLYFLAYLILLPDFRAILIRFKVRIFIFKILYI